MPKMLWLCLSLPRLPIEVFQRAGASHDPLAVIDELPELLELVPS